MLFVGPYIKDYRTLDDFGVYIYIYKVPPFMEPTKWGHRNFVQAQSLLGCRLQAVETNMR